MRNYLCPMLLGLVATLAAASVSAQLQRGEPAPDFRATDIHGNTVTLSSLIGEGPHLVIVHFFSIATGEEIALKLRYLDSEYGRTALRIVALGMEEDEAELREFANRLDISYYLLSRHSLEDAPWLEHIHTVPLSMFVQADEDRRIERVLVGAGRSEAELFTEVAENFFQQRRPEALEIASEAGDRQLKGYILASRGMLDEAEAEFGEIESVTGLARVAYERGEYDKAISLADQAPSDDGYALAIKGQALARKGEVAEAAKFLEQAEEAAPRDWQRSESVNARARVDHEQGDHDAAIERYRRAVALDPYNVVALSNEGAAHREAGDLEAAEEVLERASRIRDDDLVVAMLSQIRQEMQQANDVRRGELIRAQIQDLRKMYEERREAGDLVDPWTTRPLVLALLPSSRQSRVFFERAGLDVAIEQELISKLRNDGRVRIVERVMLQELLQELNLGASELASADTQRRLGEVLSAGYLGFIEYVQIGGASRAYLRLVDTETTAIAVQAATDLREDRFQETVDALAEAMLEGVTKDRVLQGLIATVEGDEAIIIDLGADHGAEAGQQFQVYEEGEPIEVGGRVIAHRQRPVALLEIAELNPNFATCRLVELRDGAQLEPGMKLKSVE